MTVKVEYESITYQISIPDEIDTGSSEMSDAFRMMINKIDREIMCSATQIYREGGYSITYEMEDIQRYGEKKLIKLLETFAEAMIDIHEKFRSFEKL